MTTDAKRSDWRPTMDAVRVSWNEVTERITLTWLEPGDTRSDEFTFARGHRPTIQQMLDAVEKHMALKREMGR